MNDHYWPSKLEVLITFSLMLPVTFGSIAIAGVTDRQASRPAPEGWELSGDLDNGKIIYKQYCQKCHGKRGDGQGTMAKDLEMKPRNFTDKEVMLNRSDWEIYLGIKEGGAPVGLSEQMTAWEDALIEEEILDVAFFIRQFTQSDKEGD
ncbi:MAG: cytochrome c [Thermoanaerobaculia bacterium]